MHQTTKILFLVFAIVLLGLLGVPAFAFAAGPLRQPSPSPWAFVGRLTDIPDDGLPRRLAMRVPDKDTWVRNPDKIVGWVFLRRIPGDRRILALQPYHHGVLRVGVEYDAHARRFQSCWRVRFDLDGKEIAEEGISLMGDRMEAVPVRIVGGDVFVRLDRR